MPKRRDTHDDFAPTRSSLLRKVRNLADEGSWREFDQMYRQVIFKTVVKAGLSEEDARDVVQETFRSLARKLPGFRYDPTVCAFKTWLYRITQRRVFDHWRKRGRQVESKSGEISGEGTDGIAMGLASEPELEAVWNAEWRAHLREQAIRAVREQVTPEQFQMFDFHVLQNWPVRKVAQALDVTPMQVYLAKHRISKRLKDEIKTLEARLA